MRRTEPEGHGPVRYGPPLPDQGLPVLLPGGEVGRRLGVLLASSALALSALHGFFVHWTRDFASDHNRHSQTFYRVINELPTVILIAMVLLAVLKPF